MKCHNLNFSGNLCSKKIIVQMTVLWFTLTWRIELTYILCFFSKRYANCVIAFYDKLHFTAKRSCDVTPGFVYFHFFKFLNNIFFFPECVRVCNVCFKGRFIIFGSLLTTFSIFGVAQARTETTIPMLSLSKSLLHKGGYLEVKEGHKIKN